MSKLTGWGYPCKHGHLWKDGVEYMVKTQQSWKKCGFWKKPVADWYAQTWPVLETIESVQAIGYPAELDAL